MRYAGIRLDPRANSNPLRSLSLYRPAAQVMGWTAQQKAEFCVKRDRTALDRATTYLPIAYAGLGKANRVKGPMRRRYQADAFRRINQARANVSAARKALAASEAALLALASDLFGGLA